MLTRHPIGYQRWREVLEKMPTWRFLVPKKKSFTSANRTKSRKRLYKKIRSIASMSVTTKVAIMFFIQQKVSRYTNPARCKHKHTYEVEKILDADDPTLSRKYLIRWKDYTTHGNPDLTSEVPCGCLRI